MNTDNSNTRREVKSVPRKIQGKCEGKSEEGVMSHWGRSRGGSLGRLGVLSLNSSRTVYWTWGMMFLAARLGKSASLGSVGFVFKSTTNW